MTTFAPPAVESDIRDQPVPASVPLAADQNASNVTSHINGLAVQANSALSELPATAQPKTDPPPAVDASAAAPKPETNGIHPETSTDGPADPPPSKTSIDAILADNPTPPASEPMDLQTEKDPEQLVEAPAAQDTATVAPAQVGEHETAIATTESLAPASNNDGKSETGSGEAADTTHTQPSDPTPEVVEAPAIVADEQAETQDEEMTDAPAKLAREREEDDDDGADSRNAKRVKTDESMPDAPEPAESAEPTATPAQATGTDDKVSQTGSAPSSAAPASTDAPTTSTSAPAPPAAATGQPANFAPPQGTPATDSSPMSDIQKKRLLDGMRNLKKAKNAFNFLKPVDYIALNLPNYPSIVKNPIDLSSIENKLKDGKYETVDAYSADWDLMVNNAVAFNGQAHIVAQQGMMLRSQLWAQLRKLPKAGEAAPAPPPKKQATSLASAIRDTPRRAPAPPPPPPPAVATPVQETFAAPNGVPTIRRGSSVGGRPKREIHKPTRDLAYQSAKPIKKKHKAEIDFAKHVLDELTRPRYEQLFVPFYKPVDPVALAIPHYFSVIKKPMSLSVVKDKLNTSQYETLKEVETDIKLIWFNCYKFNGKGHAVSNMAASYEKLFEEEFGKKSEWIATHAPASVPQSPVDESGSSDEDEEEEEEDPEAAQIAIIQRQMQELQEKTMALLEQKAAKKLGGQKKTKGGAKAAPATTAAAKKRKSSGVGGGAAGKAEKKTKAKAKERAVTVAEKQEISSKIGDLNAEQITKAAELIKASLRKIGRNDLADKAEDDMEFDIDQIPNDALHELLKLVRKASAPLPAEETSYTAPKSSYAAPAKSKKNKPMSKAEQEDHIRRLQGQLANFENGVAVGSPEGNDESSEDDDESGSESEEE